MDNINMSKNNKHTEDNDMTIRDVSNELDIAESTVKKYLKDFNLEFEKGNGAGSKILVSKRTFEFLSEIVKLRAEGLSIQEIKELKSQKPIKNILDEEENVLNEIVDSSIGQNTVELDKYESDLDEKTKEGVNEITEEGVITADERQGEEPQEDLRKRRGFNYRYVERQVSTDSKRISSLRQRLRNPNLSVQDRLFFEEALERRILFLNGWKHILRWINTK